MFRRVCSVCPILSRWVGFQTMFRRVCSVCPILSRWVGFQMMAYSKFHSMVPCICPFYPCIMLVCLVAQIHDHPCLCLLHDQLMYYHMNQSSSILLLHYIVSRSLKLPAHTNNCVNSQAVKFFT
jgi:hypothetical protein